MFSWQHYVPIMKWKRAEMIALAKLDGTHKKLITPFLQLLMPPPKSTSIRGQVRTPKEMLDESIGLFKHKSPEIAEEIRTHWGTDPIFIDVSLVDASVRLFGVKTVLDSGRPLGTTFIPVLRLQDRDDFNTSMMELAKVNGTGFCLRVTRSDFKPNNGLGIRLATLLKQHTLDAGGIDLVVDFQESICTNLADLIKQVPEATSWRTLTFACGSFPVDLTQCSLGENYVDRTDWSSWYNLKTTARLARTPSFGDYTIQHPIYKESTQFFAPSASIRYTLADKWLIMRGQKRKSAQYLANARLITQNPGFYGQSFSYGDQYIAEKGSNLKGKSGNAKTWLTAGINHHLVCTVNQIASLT